GRTVMAQVHLHMPHWPRIHNLVLNAEPHLSGPNQKEWLDRLDAELPTIIRVIEGLNLHPQREEPALQLVGALGRFWCVRGHVAEGRRLLEATLARPGGSDESRMKALRAAGEVAYAQTDYPAAEGFLNAALSYSRSLSQRPMEASLLNALGMVARERGRLSD